MGNSWGKKINLSIFGESHGEAIGIVIDGLPAGLHLDMEKIQKEMERRKPGKDDIETARKEDDKVKILSGFFEGKTTGSPLCAIIENKNAISKDYNRNIIRPGHSDFTGFVKYNGFNDYRGGGHFSGRVTASLVFAGTIAKQILNEHGIVIGSHIKKIENICDNAFDKVNITKEELVKIAEKDFPAIDEIAGNNMKNLIIRVKENQDSVGGEIECAILGIKPGIGEPFFDSIESKISGMMFSVPAVKGIEFGAGFKFSDMCGSHAHDEFYIEDDKICTYTNNNGGINGGISNGMPIIFNVVIKPTPSIGKEQKTVDIEKKENTIVSIEGRHDPCIVKRAVPVIEAAASLAILDFII